MSRTCLVTGANGFIGSHLVEYLRERGDRPLPMVRKSASLRNLGENAKWDYRHGSVEDVPSLVAAMEDVEIVFHLAGSVAAFREDDLRRVNTQGTANVLEAARRAKPGPRRVVYVSSLEAAGPSHPDLPRAEHHVPEPFTAYGRSKFGGEQEAFSAAARNAKEGRGPDIVIVRPPLVYGPRDTEVLQMIKSAAMGVVARAGFRDAPISAIHARDLVRGIVLAAEKGRPLPGTGEASAAARGPEQHVLAGGGLAKEVPAESPSHPAGQGIYFFDDSGKYSVSAFGHAAARAMGRRAFTVSIPGPLATFFAWINEWMGRARGKPQTFNRDKVKVALSSGMWVDARRARAELGYEPETPLERGLEDTVRWLRDHGQL
jgi:nucleoside-diphosphate-sugar epimerase